MRLGQAVVLFPRAQFYELSPETHHGSSWRPSGGPRLSNVRRLARAGGGCLRVVLASLALMGTARAQSAMATLSGIAVDESDAALPDVMVIATDTATGVERKATTGRDGRFVIPLPPGRYAVSGQRSGFTPARVNDVVLRADEVTEIRLELRIAPISETVPVRAAADAGRAAPSTIDVSPEEVRGVAGGGENVYRVLQTLPGVTAVNDFDSRLSVRGGGPDQNLTLMDGVEIHNPYRLFGLTSAFNPETVERFELSAGGFSAKYGDRLSSILVIDNRNGTDARRIAGSVNAAFTDANVVTEGRMPGTATGSWLATARRTYYDLIAEPLVGGDLPGFTDLQARGVWSPRAGHRFTLFGLASRESTDADIEGETEGERLSLLSSTHNDLAAASYFLPIRGQASSMTTVSWYRNRESLDFNGDFRSGSQRSNRPDEDAQPFASVVFTRSVDVRDVAVRQEFTIRASEAHLLETGFETHALETSWGWRISGDRNPNEANGSSALGGAGLPSFLDSVRPAARAGAWLTDRWAVTSRLTVEPGVRIDWSELADEVTASPRLAMSAELSRGVRLRAAGGLFTQGPGYEKMLQSDYFLDLTSAETLGLRSERAWHALVSVERGFPSGLLARVEGYYKGFERMIVGRLETPDEVAARVATYDFPSDLTDQVPRAPQITSVPGNDGTGQSYGVEIYVARPARSAADRLTGWGSYTWGRADTTAYGRRYAADYDRPHALSLVANYRLTRLVALGTTVRAQSGFPCTTPLGVRVAAVADTGDLDGDGNTSELVPERDPVGLLVWTPDYGDVSNLNSCRLPAFVRVDLRATFHPGWQNGRWQLYAEVINLLNRDNTSQLETELVYDPNSDRPSLSTGSGNSLPLLPSFGVRFRF